SVNFISLFAFCFNFWLNFFFSSRRRHTRWPRDWSSDVCSSDLPRALWRQRTAPACASVEPLLGVWIQRPCFVLCCSRNARCAQEIGRASCRERVCIPVVEVSL